MSIRRVPPGMNRDDQPEDPSQRQLRLSSRLPDGTSSQHYAVPASIAMTMDQTELDMAYARIHIAARQGDAHTVTRFLNAGGTVDRRDAEGCTLLHCAAHQGKVEMCRLLLQRRAEVNAQDTAGRTPLMLACQSGHMEVVLTLLLWGADLALRSNVGKTAEEMAAQFGHRNIARAIREHIQSFIVSEADFYLSSPAAAPDRPAVMLIRPTRHAYDIPAKF